MRKYILTPLLFIIPIYAANVDIVSNFNILDIPISTQAINAGYTINGTGIDFYEQTLNSLTAPQARKVVVWNYYLDPRRSLFQLPKEKLIYFLWEPWDIPFEYYSHFSRIYTWNDELVDNVKFFKFYYPFLKPMRDILTPFEERKFCVMVASNWTTLRKNIIRFFESKPAGELDCFGYSRYNTPCYLGPIPGGHSGEQKISVLSRYRFCICFENTQGLKGYITEKIFACFAAGCLPVYWGAANIESYIPKNCFIDYRDFQSPEELYAYLKTMSKETFETYLNNIRTYLNSEKAQLFSETNFGRIFYDAISH